MRLPWAVWVALPLLASVSSFDMHLLDCGVRRLILSRAVALQPWRDSRFAKAAFDSLELASLCGDPPPLPQPTPTPPLPAADGGQVFYVNATGVLFSANTHACTREGATGGSDDITNPERGLQLHLPFATVHAALHASRRRQQPRTIVLRGGVHFLSKPLALTAADRGLRLVAAAGESAWLSGGVVIPADAPWKPAAAAARGRATAPQVWKLHLPDLDDVPGLFSVDLADPDAESGHRRFVRARFPNADPETDRWGYASEGRLNFSIPAAAAAEWHRPPAGGPGRVPTVFNFTDLSARDNPSGAVKNDSTMAERAFF